MANGKWKEDTSIFSENVTPPKVKWEFSPQKGQIAFKRKAVLNWEAMPGSRLIFVVVFICQVNTCARWKITNRSITVPDVGGNIWKPLFVTKGKNNSSIVQTKQNFFLKFQSGKFTYLYVYRGGPLCTWIVANSLTLLITLQWRLPSAKKSLYWYVTLNEMTQDVAASPTSLFS